MEEDIKEERVHDVLRTFHTVRAVQFTTPKKSMPAFETPSLQQWTGDYLIKVKHVVYIVSPTQLNLYKTCHSFHVVHKETKFALYPSCMY